MAEYVLRVNGLDHRVQCSDADEAKRRGYLTLDEAEPKPSGRKRRTPANKAATPDDKSND